MSAAYCTIASANYLPRVKVLADSLAKHQPGAVLHILLCEWPELCQTLATKTGFPFLSPADVCPDWKHMAFSYDVTEFNTALKPFLLAHLLRNHGDIVFYLDPDIEIFGSLDQLEDIASKHALILTPHVSEPVAMDGRSPGMDAIIQLGQFNLGFIGLTRNAEVDRALLWWQEVCIDYCIADPQRGYFVDQFWAAALPSFIQNFYCLREPGYNVAYWNVFQRGLERAETGWQCNGKELRFFHFSGLPAHDLTLVSRYQDRVSAPDGSALYRLLTEYAEKIKTNVWSEFATVEYSFLRFSDGGLIRNDERRAFLDQPRTQRQKTAAPFSGANNEPKGFVLRSASIRLIRGLGVRLGEFADVTEARGLRIAITQSLRYMWNLIFR